MKYVSIDIETTGLGSGCQILQLAAVLDDTEWPLERSPTFNALAWDSWYSGEPFALALNKPIFDTLAKHSPGEEVQHLGKPVKIVDSDDLVYEFKEWLHTYTGSEIVLAGKNVAGFDLRFLKNLSGWSDLSISHRVIDPGNLFLQPDDKTPPNTQECLRRAGIDRTVTHDALDDAYDVCMLIRCWECRARSTR
jgi:DNA polymerase III epsilon subunit-like protein